MKSLVARETEHQEARSVSVCVVCGCVYVCDRESESVCLYVCVCDRESESVN